MNKLFVIIIILLYQFPGTVFGLEYCPGSIVTNSVIPANDDNLQNWTNCFGTFISDGELKYVYVGEWKDGRFHGQGTFTMDDGGKYIGGFKDGNFHGQAISTMFGRKFVGEYIGSKKHGQGTMTMADGSQYVGEFRNDEFHGQGSYTWASGTQYEGEWKDGTMEGQATKTLPNGNQYVGQFKDNNFNGQGTYTWADGAQYVGEFKDSEPHGYGTHTTPNGIKQMGVFENGVFKEEISRSTDSSNIGFECIPTLSKSEVQSYINLGRLSGYGAMDDSQNGTPYSWRSTPDYYLIKMNE